MLECVSLEAASLREITSEWREAMTDTAERAYDRRQGIDKAIPANLEA